MTVWPSALKEGRGKNALRGLATIQVTVVSQLHLHVFTAGNTLLAEMRLGF